MLGAKNGTRAHTLAKTFVVLAFDDQGRPHTTSGTIDEPVIIQHPNLDWEIPGVGVVAHGRVVDFKSHLRKHIEEAVPEPAADEVDELPLADEAAAYGIPIIDED